MTPKSVTCPQCGGPMVKTWQSRNGGFDVWTCATYPACTGTARVWPEQGSPAADIPDTQRPGRRW